MRIVRIILATLAVSLILGTVPGLAQSTSGSPHDLSFDIINATTQQAGQVERLQLEYKLGVLQPVFDLEPEGSLFTVPEVPVKERGQYVITAWAEGVPYYRSLRGRELLEGTVVLHVFDVIPGLDDVAITGLDVVMRRTETLLEAEYMLQVENRARPQATVIPSPPLEISLPAAARSATLSFGNMTRTLDISSGKARLEIPLTSGRNALRLKVRLEFEEGMEMPVGANVPIEAWGLLATPPSLDIRGFGLETAAAQGGGTHIRFKGQALGAGENYAFRLATTAIGGEEEDLFTQQAAPADKAAAEKTEDAPEEKGFPFVVLTPILVVILASVASKRRR